MTTAPPGVPEVDVLNPRLGVNPVKGWNVVYLPYCDGSFYGGDAEHDDDPFAILAGDVADRKAFIEAQLQDLEAPERVAALAPCAACLQACRLGDQHPRPGLMRPEVLRVVRDAGASGSNAPTAAYRCVCGATFAVDSAAGARCATCGRRFSAEVLRAAGAEADEMAGRVGAGAHAGARARATAGTSAATNCRYRICTPSM